MPRIRGFCRRIVVLAHGALEAGTLPMSLSRRALRLAVILGPSVR
jgi:hypothetical protein